MKAVIAIASGNLTTSECTADLINWLVRRLMHRLHCDIVVTLSETSDS